MSRTLARSLSVALFMTPIVAFCAVFVRTRQDATALMIALAVTIGAMVSVCAAVMLWDYAKTGEVSR